MSALESPTELTGAGWVLRLPLLSDADAFCDLFMDPEVQEFNGGAYDREGALRLLEDIIERNAAEECLQFVLELPPKSEIAAIVGFNNLAKEGGVSEFGCSSARRLWQTGIMFSVCSSLLNQADIRAVVGRIEALVHCDNGRALNFLRKLGFEIDVTFTSTRDVHMVLDTIKLHQ